MISEKLFGYTKPGDNMIEYEEWHRLTIICKVTI